MRKKNYKGCPKKQKLSKCEGVCKTFDAIQYAYADNDIVENRCKTEPPYRNDRGAEEHNVKNKFLLTSN